MNAQQENIILALYGNGGLAERLDAYDRDSDSLLWEEKRSWWIDILNSAFDPCNLSQQLMVRLQDLYVYIPVQGGLVATMMPLVNQSMIDELGRSEDGDDRDFRASLAQGLVRLSTKTSSSSRDAFAGRRHSVAEGKYTPTPVTSARRVLTGQSNFTPQKSLAEPPVDELPNFDGLYEDDHSDSITYWTQPPRSLTNPAQSYEDDGDYDIVLYAHKPKVKAEATINCQGVGRRKNTTFITPFGLFQLDQSGEFYILIARGAALQQSASLKPYVDQAAEYQDAPHSIKAELNTLEDSKRKAFLVELNVWIDSAGGRKPWVNSDFKTRQAGMLPESPFKTMRKSGSADNVDKKPLTTKTSRVSAFQAFTMLHRRLWLDQAMTLSQADLATLANPIQGWADIRLDDGSVKDLVSAYNDAVSRAALGSEVSHELRSVSRQLLVMLPQIIAAQTVQPLDSRAMQAVLDEVDSPFLVVVEPTAEADLLRLRYQALCEVIQKAFPFEAIEALIYGENGLANQVRPYAKAEVSQKHEELHGLIRDYLQSFATAEIDAWLRDNQALMATNPARALSLLNRQLRDLAALSTDSAKQQSFAEALEVGLAHCKVVEVDEEVESLEVISKEFVGHLIGLIQQLERQLQGCDTDQAQAALQAQAKQADSPLRQLEIEFDKLPFGHSSMLWDLDAIKTAEFDLPQAINELKTRLWNIPYDVDIHNALYPDTAVAIKDASSFFERHAAVFSWLTAAGFDKAADDVTERFDKIGLDPRWYFTQISEALYGFHGVVERRVAPDGENRRRANKKLSDVVRLFKQAVVKLGLESSPLEELNQRLEKIVWDEDYDLLHELHHLHSWLAQQFEANAREQAVLAAVLDRGLLGLEAEPLVPYEKAAEEHRQVVVNAATFAANIRQIEAVAPSGNIHLLGGYLNAWIPDVRLFDIAFPAGEKVESDVLVKRAIDVLLAMPAYIDLYASQKKTDSYRFCDRAFKPLDPAALVSLLDQALAEVKPKDPHWHIVLQALEEPGATYTQAIRDHLSPDIVRALGQEFVAQSLQKERSFASHIQQAQGRVEELTSALNSVTREAEQFRKESQAALFSAEQQKQAALLEVERVQQELLQATSIPAPTTARLMSSTCEEHHIPIAQSHDYHHLGVKQSEGAHQWYVAQKGEAQKMAGQLHHLPTGGIVDVSYDPGKQCVTMGTQQAAKVQAFVRQDMVGLRASMTLNFPEGCDTIEAKKRYIKETCQALAKTSALAFYTAQQQACTHEGKLDKEAFAKQLKQSLSLNAQSSQGNLVSKTDHYYARCLYNALCKLGFTYVNLDDKRPSVESAHVLDSVKTSHHDERLIHGDSMRSLTAERAHYRDGAE